jgi:aspartyl-tRNA(Asn)/glutamyl-tRNA(Gln) amidotransferase subunit A
MREIWRLSATELGAAYGGGELSPVDVLEALLERIARINPRLNSIVTLDERGARTAAAASAQRWRAGASLGVLDGVPLTVKDNIPVRALRTTWGSRLYADFVPERDELPVARLRAAGAVILGKTNVPEFTLQGYTDNPLFGATRNPWNLTLTTGGSSGGAVAAVAAGLGPLAIGTDGGGSIRRPASHAGLVGLKTSLGRVARCDGLPAILLEFETIGPMARTVADVVLALHATSAPDARDPASMAFAARPFEVPATLPPRRILYAPRFGEAPVDPEIEASVAAAARVFERLGHRVVEAPRFDLADEVNEIWPVISQTGLAWLLARHPGWQHRVGAALAAMGEAGNATPAARFFEALACVNALRARLAQLFTEHDLLLTPSAAALPWSATEPQPAAIDGRPVGPRGPAVYTGFVNAAGLPAISLPCAPSRAGLPIGLQLVAPLGEDGLLCAIAAQYERAEPWADRWPALAEASAADATAAG